MGKTRMTALDVRATVEEMRSRLVGLRLQNLYDLNAKMFLMRFGHGEDKRSVLIENGVRAHLTTLEREKPKVPSQFTLKLRKHVRSWRLDTVEQLEHDRTIDFCFGVASSEGCYHIIVELFSKGNIVLTDHAYTIMMLLRTHRDEDMKLVVREKYPVRTALRPRTTSLVAELSVSAEEVERRRAALRADWDLTFTRNAEYETTRSTLSGVRHFGPSLAEHIIAITGAPNVKKGDLCSAYADATTVEEAGGLLFAALLPGMLAAWDLSHMALPSGGFLIQKEGKKKKANNNNKNNNNEVNETDAVVDAAVAPVEVAVSYEDFTPVLLAQHQGEGLHNISCASFGEVCDRYFLTTETQRIDQHNDKKKNAAVSKSEKFQRDHQRRIHKLEDELDHNRQTGELIMLHADRIDEAIGLINGSLAMGIQWDALRSLLRRRHDEGHPVAYLIHELFLERNAMTVMLERELEDDEEAAEVEPMVVEVRLDKTAHANATDYFSRRRANIDKLNRTHAATSKAAAGAARKGDRTAAKQPAKKIITRQRQRRWWENCFWFRTSAGDVVLQGKDASTTEILMRRVRQLGDLFIHCDEDKALPCLLRPLTRYAGSEELEEADSRQQRVPQVVSMRSVVEAGGWCVSRSGAWERKQSVGSYWVYASQITGGSASGAYLMEGERHYLHPQPLALACGLLFEVEREVAGGEAEKTTMAADVEENEGRMEVLDELAGRLPDTLEELRHSLVEGMDYIPADPANHLPELPSIAALREAQRRTIATTRPVPGAKGHAPASATDLGSSITTTTTTTTTAAAGKALTKHQKKKLQRIAHKYGDQDDEDRALGARINGNKLAQIQQLKIEEELRLEAMRDEGEDADGTANTRKKKKGKKNRSKAAMVEVEEELLAKGPFYGLSLEDRRVYPRPVCGLTCQSRSERLTRRATRGMGGGRGGASAGSPTTSTGMMAAAAGASAGFVEPSNNVGGGFSCLAVLSAANPRSSTTAVVLGSESELYVLPLSSSMGGQHGNEDGSVDEVEEEVSAAALPALQLIHRHGRSILESLAPLPHGEGGALRLLSASGSTVEVLSL